MGAVLFALLVAVRDAVRHRTALAAELLALRHQLLVLQRQTMHQANPIWGAPRIHGELLKLGIAVAESTVSKYLPPRRRAPARGWRTFLRNHLSKMVAVDFAVVPPVTGQMLFAFVVLSLERRRVLHINVTAQPTAVWTAQQMVEALPRASTARYLIRDRDGVYGEVFKRRIAGLGLQDVLIAARSPVAERVRGAVHRVAAPGMPRSRRDAQRASSPARRAQL